MNRIEKLIEELCPQGVEFKALGKVCDVFTGGEAPANSIKGENPSEVCKYPIFGNGVEVYGYTDTYRIDKDAVTISSIGANTGTVYFRKAFFTPIIRLKVVLPIKENLLSKYLFYYLSSIKIYSKKSSVPNMNANDVKKLQIPIPPLAIQKEIVKILDNFTRLEADLEAELEAELEARKKQYEHYREALLTFGDDVEWKALGEVCDIKNGYTPSKAKSEYWTNGTIPWFRMEDIRENGRVLSNSIQHITPEAVKGSRLFPKNSIIIATSATIGEHALITVPFLSNQRFTSLSLKSDINDNFDIKFMFYYSFILAEWCCNNTTTSSFSSVDMNGFKKFPIPIPPLSKQKEIVAILDKFDALVNDISTGLPAEITARKKQYEYYRNQLLTFKPLEAQNAD